MKNDLKKKLLGMAAGALGVALAGTGCGGDAEEAEVETSEGSEHHCSGGEGAEHHCATDMEGEHTCSTEGEPMQQHQEGQPHDHSDEGHDDTES